MTNPGSAVRPEPAAWQHAAGAGMTNPDSAVRPERCTQNRVVALFSDPSHPGCLGYRYLGDWSARDHTGPVEEGILAANLKQRGYSDAHISAAMRQLHQATEVRTGALYQANLRTYNLLRYPIQVSLAPGQPHDNVHLIDWTNPEANNFAIAEEVTLKGGHQRRPDLVLYLNGIAIGVIELKRGSVEVADGIRQLVTNQQAEFNQGFFSTVQLLLAGNDSQGLHYGTTGTPEQLFARWQDETANSSAQQEPGFLLDQPLAQLCSKARLLELMHDFIIHDAGRKKVPRPHQYFGVKAAQARIKQREGGVIWHTQGSGKSIVMVLLARWLMEHDPAARILIITDRDELDRQIEKVMRDANIVGADEPAPRITSREEFIAKLAAPAPRVLCALIHKFGGQHNRQAARSDADRPAGRRPTRRPRHNRQAARSDADPYAAITKALQGEPPPSSGNFYVFVDECHRTQGGAMNKQMRHWLKNALFIGFTGTPLLRQDRATTRAVFGSYIHTYKFHQGVADKVILDLKYEAREVPQRLTRKKQIDVWFEHKTRNLNNFQAAKLKQRWATMEKLMSSKERKDRIISSIVEDFSLRPRLNSDRGTAILVVASIYDACHYFRLLQNDTPLQGHCGIITSYTPNHNKISRESLRGDEHYKYETYTKHVLTEGQTTEQYETKVKRQFIEEPANCKLLIVVGKLLTGFDAPSCTYLYLDNELYDHNLFQAICRTNRLDGTDKPYGHIVDFKRLLEAVENAIAVYSSDELDPDQGSGGSNEVTMKDWLHAGRTDLEAARETLKHLCEPVLQPQQLEQYLLFFCGDANDPHALPDTEPQRIAFYKAVAAFVRAFAAISPHLADAGYTATASKTLADEAEHFSELRAAIKNYAGEELDTKPYEADMRHLINTYIQADPVDPLGKLDEYSLVELIIETGIHDAIAKKLNASGKLSTSAVAEAIINNVRKTIIRDQLTNPRFYEKMSKLLADLLKQKRDDKKSYKQFLHQAEALVRQMQAGASESRLPSALTDRPLAMVVYENLPAIHGVSYSNPREEGPRAAAALAIANVIRDEAPADWWEGDPTKVAQVRNALHPLLDKDEAATEALFDLIRNWVVRQHQARSHRA